MNQRLQKYARDEIKKGLSQCTADEQLLFKRMYSHKNLDLDLNAIVDRMPEEKLDWAMQQVDYTLASKSGPGDNIYVYG